MALSKKRRIPPYRRLTDGEQDSVKSTGDSFIMFLQKFTVYSLYPAVLGFTVYPLINHPCLHHQTIVIEGHRRFTADLFSPALSPSLAHTQFGDSRYPGAIIIATDQTRDRAFLIASRMSEIGVTALMYVQNDSLPHEYSVQDAQIAIDSMRRRYDVRPEEVGVIALEEASVVVPDLVHDTTLDFAVAASSAAPTRSVIARYSHARTATLLVRGVRNLRDSAAIVHALGLDAPPPADSQSRTVTPPPAGALVAPNVTVWPVPRDELQGIGDVHSPLGMRMMGWVRDQVHTEAMNPDGSVVATH